MNDDERMVYLRECLARIEEGPAAYCNPEVAHADASFLFDQLGEISRTVVVLDRMVNGG